ncbi:fizzy-related protein homolog [Halyomorpha halys]|uniref:fizzy-related protein homolog n=1 Tax=Halyomorpha halys TaxID=286706 RepID=UPI0006D4DBF2|nr:fizzy-related protein homolog [Halyomorpha halys]
MSVSNSYIFNFKSQPQLSQDVDDCEMNNVYAKRLFYQQNKGMILQNYSVNNSLSLNDKTNDENEGENMYNNNKIQITKSSCSDSLLKVVDGNSNNEYENYNPQEETSQLTERPSLYVSSVPNESSNFFKQLNSPSLSDRYIPSRGGNAWQTRFSMLPDSKSGCSKTRRCRDSCINSIAHEANREVYIAYSSLLRNELLDSNIEGVRNQCEEKRINPVTDTISLFQYSSQKETEVNIESIAPYSLSPVSSNSQKLLRSPRKATRKISRIPFKVLDAPELQDDFYLNLVDWSSQNVLSVGLGSCVYLWSACTSQVTRLCDLSTDANSVTSVSWNERGNLVAVGTHHGYVQVWDVAANKQISKLHGHSARVGALAWSGDVLSSGSRDRMILQRDVRSSSNSERRLPGHRQEVCGLKWSPDNQHLASGGNDNRLYVWNMHSLTPIQTYTEHLAAVKAIAWSPHHHGLLASGGGTADRCIRFWNTLTGQPMQCVDTGSQVCNLAWSKHSSELVSTHGYSQNQILVWKYPTLTQVAKLTGHSYRVLYLAMSPDGEAIVTGAGDETLRFWNVFSKARSQRESKSVLNLFGNIR